MILGCFKFVCFSIISVTVAGNRLVWTSRKHGPKGKAQAWKTVYIFLTPATLTKLLMLCFMSRDPNHATAEVWCYFEPFEWLKKNADLEAFRGAPSQ